VPSTSYFTTYGLKKSYLAVSEAYPDYGAMMSQYTALAQHILQAVALGGMAAAIAGASATFAAGLTLVVTTTTYVGGGAIVSTALQMPGLEAIGEEVITTVINGSVAAAPVAIILMAI